MSSDKCSAFASYILFGCQCGNFQDLDSTFVLCALKESLVFGLGLYLHVCSDIAGLREWNLPRESARMYVAQFVPIVAMQAFHRTGVSARFMDFYAILLLAQWRETLDKVAEESCAVYQRRRG
jgi:hypothetical protein